MLLVCYWFATGLLLDCYWFATGRLHRSQPLPAGGPSQPAQQSLSPAPCTPSPGSLSSSRSNLPGHFFQAIASAFLCSKVALQASSLFCKVALVDSVGDPLEASPLCSKVALADSVEDPLEAPTLCSAVASARSLWQTQSKIPSKHHLSAPRSLSQTWSKKTRSKSGQRPICGTGVPQKIATCSKAETPAPPDVNIEVRAGLSVVFSNKKLRFRKHTDNVNIQGVRGSIVLFSSVFRLLRFFEAQPSEKMSKAHPGGEIRFFAQLRALYSGCRSAHIHNPGASLFVSCLARDHVLLLCSKVALGRLS